MSTKRQGLGRGSSAKITIPELRRSTLGAAKRTHLEESGEIHRLIEEPGAFIAGIEKEISGDLEFGAA